MFVSHLRKQHWQLVTKCFLCYDMSAFSVYTASFKYWPPTSPLSPQIYGVWMLCLPSTPNVFKRKLLNVIVPGASSTCFLFLSNEVSWEANKNKKNHLKILISWWRMRNVLDKTSCDQFGKRYMSVFPSFSVLQKLSQKKDCFCHSTGILNILKLSW